MEINIPLTKLSDKLFNEENVKGGKVELTPSAPQLSEANKLIQKMHRSVMQENIYGLKDKGDD